MKYSKIFYVAPVYAVACFVVAALWSLYATTKLEERPLACVITNISVSPEGNTQGVKATVMSRCSDGQMRDLRLLIAVFAEDEGRPYRVGERIECTMTHFRGPGDFFGFSAKGNWHWVGLGRNVDEWWALQNQCRRR